MIPPMSQLCSPQACQPRLQTFSHSCTCADAGMLLSQGCSWALNPDAEPLCAGLAFMHTRAGGANHEGVAAGQPRRKAQHFHRGCLWCSGCHIPEGQVGSKKRSTADAFSQHTASQNASVANPGSGASLVACAAAKLGLSRDTSWAVGLVAAANEA